MKKCILAIMAMSAMVGIAFADEYDWTGVVNGNWSETNNWVGLAKPGALGTTDLYFTNDTVNVATTNDTSTALKRSDIVFGPNPNGAWSISGNNLTAGNLGNTSITLLDGAGTVTINSKVEFAVSEKPHTLIIDGADTLEFNGDFDNTTGGDVIFTGGKSTSKVQLNGATKVIGGDWQLEKQGSLVLGAAGSMTFEIGANGVNKKIVDSNPTSWQPEFKGNGTFIFDLTAAGTMVGDSWTIVDLVTPDPAKQGTATWDATFNVQDFTETSVGSGIWIDDASGGYQFTTTPSNGVLSVLSVIEAPELEVPVWEGIDGCVFQMDAKEHYRFSIDATDQRVTGWDGVYGVGQVDALTSKHPIYVENSFNGINALDLPVSRFMRCVFDAPVNEFQVFAVYWPDSAAPAALVVDFDEATQVLVDSGRTGASFALDTGTPTYASDGVNYTGPAIYAAMNERSSVLMSLMAGAGTQIRMNDSTANGGEALFMFKTPGVSFKAGVDVLSIGSAFVSSAARLDSATMRFVVEEAGQFYISDASASHATSYSVNALTANWYAYDPSTIAGVSVIGAAATPAFASIDSIGYLLSAEGPASGGGGVNFGVTKFTAQAGGQEVLIDHPDFEVELWTSSDAAPAIAVGTASGLTDMDQLFLGKTYNGKVAEVVVFDHQLSVEEEQLVYDRLNVKWIERVSRDVPNLFKTLLGKTDAQFEAARATVSANMLHDYYTTSDHFRGDTNTIYALDDSSGEVSSRHAVEWLPCILMGENDKAMFDQGVNLFEDYHWHWDAVVGQWFFNATVYESGEEYRSTYVGQGHDYGLATVLYQAYAKWREPRYLELADRHAAFWQAHKGFEDPASDREVIYSANNAAGYGKGIIKMFPNDSLGLDAYTECTYMQPLGCRLAAEFGASVDAEFYDLAPHAQNQWLLRGSHPVTGLVPATSDLQGNPVEHSGKEDWARYCDDPTEKVWDRYLNSMINYPQDMDAGLLESFNKVAAWAAGIGVDNLLNDYELDGTCTNVNVVYKGNKATEGGIATIAAMAHVVDTDLTPWVQQAWNDVGNTDRSQRGYVRSFFTISGLAQVQNDGLRKNYVSNLGFETPADLTGWDVSVASGSVATNAARRGSYGLACTYQSPSPELAASAFLAGATYRYRAWVRSTSGAQTVNVHCALDATTSSSEPWGITSDWKLIEYTFRLPSEETISSIRLWVEAGASSTFDLDDVSVVLMSAPAVMPEPMNSEATPVSMWDQWIAEYPGLGGTTNFGDHADNDLLANLAEYALGGSPVDGDDQGNTPVQSQMEDSGTNYIEFVYFERDDAVERGLTTILDVGTDLVNTNWADGSAYKVGSGTSGITNFNAVTNWIPTDEEDQQFIRLQIEFTP
ncbi:carbohydrate binding domain-containing protein [Pontiella sulfatireligans]|uniref:Uncharacterized protein n=1 Tax=Pontiella sulfatireligans TaxID=2750658 RepID=A0A6C2UQB8_9BACT|nr:hypothetical protein [Pontiella sulfatireligans]VGO22133.1 hypothetical protein SCARR_04214 [Pontiella sulfatireligans]